MLLATVQFVAYDSEGNKQLLRVLLDSGSQCLFITKEACELLSIRLQDSERTIVKGFGGFDKVINSSSVNFEIHSRYNNNTKLSIAPLVVDRIADALPSAVADTSVLSHLRNLPLADETFGTPNKIDILIGAPLCTFIATRRLSARLRRHVSTSSLTYGIRIMHVLSDDHDCSLRVLRKRRKKNGEFGIGGNCTI